MTRKEVSNKLKKLTFLAIILVLAVALVASPVLAAGKTGQAGKSNIGHLYLYEKNPADWSIVDGGAWGKMKYSLSGPTFDFVFNGHGLVPGGDYTLIYYPDPWPGNGLICLGSGMANKGGNVHIAGSPDTGDLPIDSDINEGAKIWLVLSDDVDCMEQTWATPWQWNPTEYLFENALITFSDTN